MNRENVMAALQSLIQASVGASLAIPVARKLRHWRDVPPEQQPCVFVAQGNESAVSVTRMPTVWTIDVDVYLYAYTGADSTVAPHTILNPLLDTLVALFEPSPARGEQILGGLVHKCRVTGIETDAGALGDQAVAILSLSITATP